MLNNLTGLRFYAAFWVFLFHLYNDKYISELEFLPITKGYLGVDIFFVLSGFILTYVYHKDFFDRSVTWSKYYHFIVKRFAKIYPLHLLTFFGVVVIKILSKYALHQNHLKISGYGILENLLMVHAWGFLDTLTWNMPSWSVSSEWFAYLFVFVFLAFLFRFLKIKWFVLGVSVIIFCCILWWSWMPGFKTDDFTYNSFGRIIPEFMLGSLIAFFKISIDLKKQKSTIFLLISLVFISVLFMNGNMIDLLGIFGFSGIILALSYPTHLDKLFSSKVLIFLGNVSYAFYMTGYISLEMCKHFFERFEFSHYHITFMIVKFTSAFLLNLLLASAAYTYFEEPVRKMMVRKLTGR